MSWGSDLGSAWLFNGIVIQPILPALDTYQKYLFRSRGSTVDSRCLVKRYPGSHRNLSFGYILFTLLTTLAQELAASYHEGQSPGY